MSDSACPMCDGTDRELVFRYDARPERETDFGIPPEQYGREFRRCRRCGHMTNEMEFDPATLYEGAYVDSTYAGDRLEKAFERIMALPARDSDNAQRVIRVQQWSGRDPSSSTLLDIGSGLGVFPAAMKEAGWSCTALDPDPRAAEHAEQRIGVRAVCADFMAVEDLGEFSLITLNKVLEHVQDPIAMLARCRDFLIEGGDVYVEVPDGELASQDGAGQDREEFYIEHLHAFSATSLSLLADRAGFKTQRIERVKEPSGKYTLLALLT